MKKNLHTFVQVMADRARARRIKNRKGKYSPIIPPQKPVEKSKTQLAWYVRVLSWFKGLFNHG